MVIVAEKKSDSNPVNRSESPKTNASADNCNNKSNDPGLVKNRTLNGKKRKKQNRSKNKNNNNSGNNSAAVETEAAKVTNPAARESSVPKNSSLPRDRFSSKSGQCKPNR